MPGAIAIRLASDVALFFREDGDAKHALMSAGIFCALKLRLHPSKESIKPLLADLKSTLDPESLKLSREGEVENREASKIL